MLNITFNEIFCSNQVDSFRGFQNMLPNFRIYPEAFLFLT
jgi:hypothetical protein